RTYLHILDNSNFFHLKCPTTLFLTRLSKFEVLKVMRNLRRSHAEPNESIHEVDADNLKTNERVDLGIKEIVANPGSTNIHPWKCPSRHIIGTDCCKTYVEHKNPGWSDLYFIFISTIPPPEGSIICDKQWVNKPKKKEKLIFCKKYYTFGRINKQIKHKKYIIYYAYPFRTSYEILKELHSKIEAKQKEEEKKKGKAFFPSKQYPSPTKKSQTKNAKKSDNSNAKILRRTSFPWFMRLHAGTKQVDKIREFCERYLQLSKKKKKSYIQHLFSSPSLVLCNWFFEKLVEKDTVFCESLKQELIGKARQRLEKWNQKATLTTLQFADLKDKTAANSQYNFHTAYVVRKPLDQSRLLYHWALAFEGKYLLRVEFFDDNCVKWVLLENSNEHKRVFWYAPSEFTQRWLLLLTLPALRRDKALHVSKIGVWLENWHRRHDRYSVLTNNCQHFVRDMVAHFNTDKALDLNGLMDVQSGTALIPGLLLSHNLNQFVRTYDEWKLAKADSRLELPTAQPDNPNNLGSEPNTKVAHPIPVTIVKPRISCLDSFYSIIANKDNAKTFATSK
ncbi:hypothetical protein RFI_14201, partial [Reticulomyxa filosa]